MRVKLDLPWPPSVNHYWRSNRGRVHISDECRDYRQTVFTMTCMSPAFGGADRLSCLIKAHPPDRRLRDLDNVQKALLDAITKAGIWADDSQIDDLRIVRMAPERGGFVHVVISNELTAEEE